MFYSSANNRRSSGTRGSLADSDIISETQEIEAVKDFQQRASVFLENDNIPGAIAVISDALEIDKRNAHLLLTRSRLFCALEKYDCALADADYLVSINQFSCEVSCFKAAILRKLERNEEAINQSIRCLSLSDINTDKVKKSIVSSFKRMCPHQADFVQSLINEDCYSFLCQLGVLSSKEHRHHLAINFLEVAQTYETDQLGLKMMMLLTLANSYSAKRYSDTSIELFKECLAIATQCHDINYQIKCLVNIAALYLQDENASKAAIFYQKLLDLKESCTVEDLGSEWNCELECALYLNLSISHACLGNLVIAREHAVKCSQVAESSLSSPHLQTQCFSTCGITLLKLELFDKAIGYFEKAVKYCKKTGDLGVLSICYGNLGSAYASLKNSGLSGAFHDQQITAARKSGVRDLIIKGLIAQGESRLKLGQFDLAIESFNCVYKEALLGSPRFKQVAEMKLGDVYLTSDRPQHALYHYQNAIQLVDQESDGDKVLELQFHIAQITQLSSSLDDLEKAEKVLHKLVLKLERQLEKERVPGADVHTDLLKRIRSCYTGLGNIAAKMGKPETALIMMEAAKRKTYSQYFVSLTSRYEGLDGPLAVGQDKAMKMNWDLNKIKRIVDMQASDIVYISLVADGCLVFVLSPSKGLIRFDHRTNAKGFNKQEMYDFIGQINSGVDYKKLHYFSESRALPQTNEHLIKKMQFYEKLSVEYKKKILQEKYKLSDDKGTDDNDVLKVEKSAEVRLYRMLFGGLEEYFDSLFANSSLTLICDDSLISCPFELLPCSDGQLLGRKFSVLRSFSFFYMDCAINNELDKLRSEDDLNFARDLVCKAGNKQSLQQHHAKQMDGSQSPTKKMLANVRTSTDGLTKLSETKGRQLSNPHLLHRSPQSASNHSPQSLAPLIGSVARSSPDAVANKPVASHVHTISTLVSCSATLTDVCSSSVMVPPFQQITDPDRCVVIGNPRLPKKLTIKERLWTTVELKFAHSEMKEIGEYCDCAVVEADEASKSVFLAEITRATLLHIATYACMETGCFVMAPNPNRQNLDKFEEASFLITPEDLVQCRLTAKLVVLSSGWCTQRRSRLPEQEMMLPKLLLACGAQSVLYLSWPVPNEVLRKFYLHFYFQLQEGCFISAALNSALTELQQSEQYNKPEYIGAFCLAGKDCILNLSNIRTAQLFQTIDKTEKEDSLRYQRDFLNPFEKKQFPKGAALKYELQRLLSDILRKNKHHSRNCIKEIYTLLDGALKRLFLEDPGKQEKYLSTDLEGFPVAVSLLTFLGFHFQPDYDNTTRRVVVFPYWDRDNLLIPTYHCLDSVLVVLDRAHLTETLFTLLPTSQEIISYLVDLFAITKHAEDLQLKLSDLTVKILMNNKKTFALLKALGYVIIGKFLHFAKTTENKEALNACLQLCLGISTHKHPSLMHKLDVQLLGTKAKVDGHHVQRELSRLSTLDPIVVPRNELRISTPWMTLMESASEMVEKLFLSETKTRVEMEVDEAFRRTKTWQLDTMKTKLESRPMTKSGYVSAKTKTTEAKPEEVVIASSAKVKVKSGGTPSMARVPIDYVEPLTLPEIALRRTEAHKVLEERLKEVEERGKDRVKELYLPYITNQ